jgi:hypothetical protein
VLRPASLLLLLALAPAALAQPGTATLAAWQDDWDRSSASLASVTTTETLTREMSGPRGARRMAVESRVRYTSRGRPERTVVRAQVNGTAITAEQLAEIEHRSERALGRASREAVRPPYLPGPILHTATVAEATATQQDGRNVWRLRLTRSGRADGELIAWFTRSSEPPQLLRVDYARRDNEGRVERTVEYARRDGLDLPVRHRTQTEVRQQRRLRTYAIVLTVEASYTGHTVERE